MKKILMMLVVAATTMSMSAEYPDWLHIGKYAEANKELQAKPNNGDRVIFMGNSITECWYLRHKDFFDNNSNYICRGIGGETTCQFLNRFREDVINNKPAIVIINGGTNDIALNTGDYNPDFTFGNIASMAELARANGIKVVLTSILPVDIYPWRQEVVDPTGKIQSMNARIRKYAEENGFTYVDYYTPMVVEKGALNPPYK